MAPGRIPVRDYFGPGAGDIIGRRAQELGIRFVKVSSVNKCVDFREIIDGAGVLPEEVAFVGDDVGDIELMKLVGLPVAVADAHEFTKACSAFVTTASGGMGAVRELIDMLLEDRAV